MDRFIKDIKQRMDEKNDLLQERKSIMDRIKNGKEFIIKVDYSANRGQLSQASTLIVQLINELEAIDTRIIDIDIIIIAELEAFCSDFVAKVSIKNKINQAGDVIDRQEVCFVPYNSDNPQYIEVTPDDLWFLKLLKVAVGVNNVEIISKEQYYK
jgi:hypothetical protein